MCRIGDIVLIYRYRDHGSAMMPHSFVVLDDQNGKIKGLDFDFIGLVMSSFKNEKQKRNKMAYPGNFPVVPEDQDIKNNNEKSGYIKGEQFYYFRKDRIKYKVIGCLHVEIFNLLIDFIEELSSKGIQFQQIIDNL